MGVVDGRTNKFDKAWNFNQFANQCMISILESGKHGYNDLATPRELQLALAQHQLEHTAKEWSSIGEEFKKLKDRVNELEEELQREKAGLTVSH